MVILLELMNHFSWVAKCPNNFMEEIVHLDIKMQLQVRYLYHPNSTSKLLSNDIIKPIVLLYWCNEGRSGILTLLMVSRKSHWENK